MVHEFATELIWASTVAIAIFFNSLGGALSISIAQNIFVQGLREEIPRSTSNVDPGRIVAAGATSIESLVPSDQVGGLLYAYNLALRHTFTFAIAAAGIGFLASLFVSWIQETTGLQRLSPIMLTYLC